MQHHLIGNKLLAALPGEVAGRLLRDLELKQRFCRWLLVSSESLDSHRIPATQEVVGRLSDARSYDGCVFASGRGTSASGLESGQPPTVRKKAAAVASEER